MTPKRSTEKSATKTAELGIDTVFFCGESMKFGAEQIADSHYAPTKSELIDLLKANSFEDATILIKASRGMALEDVVDYL